MKSFGNKIGSKENQINTLNADLTSVIKENEELKSNLRESEQNFQELKNKFEHSKSALEEQERQSEIELDKLERELKIDFSAEKQRLSREIEETTFELNSKEEELQALRREIAVLIDEFNLEKSKLEDKLTVFKDRIEQISSEKTALESKIREGERLNKGKVSEIQNDVLETRKELDFLRENSAAAEESYKNELHRKEREISDILLKTESLQDSLSNEQSINRNLQFRVESLTEDLKSAEIQDKQVRETNSELKQEITHLKAKNQILARELKKSVTELNLTAKKLKTALLSEISTANKELIFEFGRLLKVTRNFEADSEKQNILEEELNLQIQRLKKENKSQINKAECLFEDKMLENLKNYEILEENYAKLKAENVDLREDLNRNEAYLTRLNSEVNHFSKDKRTIEKALSLLNKVKREYEHELMNLRTEVIELRRNLPIDIKALKEVRMAEDRVIRKQSDFEQLRSKYESKIDILEQIIRKEKKKKEELKFVTV